MDEMPKRIVACTAEYVRADLVAELVEALKAWTTNYEGWNYAELAKRADPATMNRLFKSAAAIANVKDASK